MRKLEELVAQGRVHARFRRPEPFRRLTCTLLARVLTEEGGGGVHAQLLDLRTPDEFTACHIMQGAPRVPAHASGMASRAANRKAAR